VRALILFLRRRIALKLTVTLVGFTAIAALFAGLFINRALEGLAAESLEARLAAVGAALHDEARDLVRSGAGGPALQAFALRASRAVGARVTLILPDGRVVAESGAAPGGLEGMENHGARPEVREARAGRVGRDLRTSATLDTPLLYVATPLRDGDRVIGVLRLALPLAAVTASYETVHRVMLGAAVVALVVALGIGLFVSGRVTRPVIEMQSIARQLSEGNFSVRAPVRSPDEIGTLGRSLNVLAARLREKIQDLAQEQAKMAAIVDGMVEGVIAVDGHDHIFLMNERARAIFNLGPGRLERKPFLEVIRNADLHDVFRAGRAAGTDGAEERAVVQRELRLSTPVDRALQVHAAAIRLGAGETGVAMVLHDITALRQLEQVRTEFVANVSHELRTPLTAIQGYLETLLGGAMDDPAHARRFLEVAFRHTERLGRLLNDLADLSNIELGRVTMHMGPVALGDLVEETFAIIRAKAEAGGVALEARLAPDLPPVEGDHDRLAQVLINLVDNAVKYTPAGGKVTVEAAADGRQVELVVADTGIGIPPADLPRITERFYRVDKARSRDLGGTGLGLAIVKHLVAAHGGRLTIESRPDEGTRVRIVLPVGVDGEPA
jgi:two-component system phosphate regulon sensor histidine kinase PhoR